MSSTIALATTASKSLGFAVIIRLLLFAICAPLYAAGTLTKHQFLDSEIFPGTERDYWIYLPEGHDPEVPACLMIFQDGGRTLGKKGKIGYVPDAFDELIAAGEMPMTIGLFVNPGVVPAPDENSAPRYNRSFEYDGMGPNYANFLIDELIPSLGLNLSKNPDDRAICGASSGAIAAFTAAWERPDQFRRVYSMVGTYVGLRGGNQYPALIRKTEPKPLRIFLQDGKNDLNIYAGDWWMANQTMQRALEWAGYEVKHHWDEGGHNRDGGSAILKDALRWLWKDHGKTPVETHPDRSKSRATEYLIPGKDWELASEGHNWAEGLAITADGTLYFTDVPDSELYKITPAGEQSLVARDTKRANGIALGPDGKTLYTTGGEIRAYDLATGEFETIAPNVSSNDIVVSNRGHLYFTDPRANTVWMIDLESRKKSVATKFQNPNGIGMSADQKQLFVCQFPGPFVHSFGLKNDGSLVNGQPYFYAQKPTSDKVCALDGQVTTAEGLLLVGTETGLQIFDQPGRVQLILPRPAIDDGRVNYCTMHKNTLYIATRHQIYKRETKLNAAPAWKPPVTPPKPRL